MALSNGDYDTRFSRKNKPKGVLPARHSPVYTSTDYVDFDQFLISWIDGKQTKLTAQYINNVLSGADSGTSEDQAALFQMIQERDAVVAAHLQTRKLAVAALDWQITGGDEKKRTEVTEILKASGLRHLINHLLDAIPTGYAGSAIDWLKGGSRIKGYKHVNPTNWRFDRAGNPGIIINGMEKGLNEYHRFAFTFHSYTLKPGIPATGGILRPLVWIYFFKNYAIKYKTRYLEKFGIPFIIEKISDADFRDEAMRSSLKNELATIGANGVGVTTKESEITFPTAAANSQNANFLEWITKLDEYYALTILGQLASSNVATGMSNGQIQENVRGDLKAADANAIAETINNQIMLPLEFYRYGTHQLQFTMDAKPSVNMTEKMNILKGLKESGYEIEDDFVEELFGMPLKKKSAQSAASPMGGIPGMPSPMPAPGSAMPQLPMSDINPRSSKQCYLSRILRLT